MNVQNTPFIIGLTGSIGMGKTTVGEMLKSCGLPLFDADAEVHRLQGPGGALVEPIEAAFPGTTTDGAVDRKTLGSIVLGDTDALKRLEAIVHPAVGQSRAQFLEENADEPMLVFDIPLLFETGGEERVDHIVVVSAPKEVQRCRVLSRPDMTEAKFEQIVSRQTPDDEKRRRADSVIDTGQSLDETRSDVEKLVSKLRTMLEAKHLEHDKG